MPLISAGLPAFASAGERPDFANLAFDPDDNMAYDNFGATTWAPGVSAAWLAYDLSGVPVNQRGLVDLIWYNDTGGYICCDDAPERGVPRAYTIEAHASDGGSEPPTDGWVTLVSVDDNTYRTREHVVDLTGYDWVRLNVTATNGGGVRIMAMDVYDLGTADTPPDSWMFYGDSISDGAMNYADVSFGSTSNFTFASLIDAVVPGHFPAQTNGGVGGVGVEFAQEHLDEWLAVFPGRFVVLAYGTNDAAAAAVTPDRFGQGYRDLVERVIAAGKVPIVPLIPWSESPEYNAGGNRTSIADGRVDVFNDQLRTLYGEYPEVVRGPDFESFLFDNPELAGGDVHLDRDGYGQMRQIWACQALSSVYRVDPDRLADSFCAPFVAYLQ